MGDNGVHRLGAAAPHAGTQGHRNRKGSVRHHTPRIALKKEFALQENPESVFGVLCARSQCSCVPSTLTRPNLPAEKASSTTPPLTLQDSVSTHTRLVPAAATTRTYCAALHFAVLCCAVLCGVPPSLHLMPPSPRCSPWAVFPVLPRLWQVVQVVCCGRNASDLNTTHKQQQTHTLTLTVTHSSIHSHTHHCLWWPADHLMKEHLHQRSQAVCNTPAVMCPLTRSLAPPPPPPPPWVCDSTPWCPVSAPAPGEGAKHDHGTRGWSGGTNRRARGL